MSKPRPLQPVHDDAEALTLLHAIRAEQREIRDELRALRAAVERTGAQPQADAATVDMLRAIWAAVGNRVFTAADLVEHASLPNQAALRTSIVAAVGALSPRRIGKALRRVEGMDISGLNVRRIDADRDGVLWAINATLRVSNSR